MKPEKNLELNQEKDQYLLVDEKILSRAIKESNLDSSDRVIEIGAGTGIITEQLANKTARVLAFEIDEKFSEKLKTLEHNNLEIAWRNALEDNWKGYNKIVSNIPYSLSEPIIVKAIISGISMMVLIVGDRLKNTLFSPDKKIGIMANLFFDIKTICAVKKESFFPVPKSDSWIVKLERKTKLTQLEKIMQGILTKSGKIKNAIKYSLVENGKTKRQAKEIVNRIGIDESILNKPAKKITAKLIQRIERGLIAQDKLFPPGTI